ncbi:MAG: serine/threonine-protein phosphatase, partial [Leptospiraceae bacterium]|nr:serine/threonine-protein phosphatase [Leptospiraceae bacterium]
YHGETIPSLYSLAPKGRVIMSVSPPFCEEVFISLNPQDIVVLYTDGITEARGSTHTEMYSSQRLINLIKNNIEADLNKITKEIIDSVIAYSGGPENLEDDLSLLCFRIKQ